MKKKYLRALDPTSAAEHVALEIAQLMIHYRTPKFSKIFAAAGDML